MVIRLPIRQTRTRNCPSESLTGCKRQIISARPGLCRRGALGPPPASESCLTTSTFRTVSETFKRFHCLQVLMLVGRNGDVYG
jgi:hypothetical protein